MDKTEAVILGVRSAQSLTLPFLEEKFQISPTSSRKPSGLCFIRGRKSSLSEAR